MAFRHFDSLKNTMHTSATPASEYSRDGADGFRPLRLPLRGEDLQPGRQYYLSPVARAIIDEVFGIRGLPSIIECLRCRVAKTRMTVTTFNYETGKEVTKVTELDGQDAAFHVRGGIVNKFTLDLVEVAKRQEMYEKKTDDSFFGIIHRKRKRYEDDDERPKSKSYSRGVNGAPLAKKVDLSILDL